MSFALLGFGVACFVGGFVIGWRWVARRERAGWALAARYKQQADEMMDRLVELEEALMEVDDD